MNHAIVPITTQVQDTVTVNVVNFQFLNVVVQQPKHCLFLKPESECSFCFSNLECAVFNCLICLTIAKHLTNISDIFERF